MNFDEAPVAVGEVLAGKYRVERVLGVGGMGVVVEALHIDLDRKVALKFILGEVAASGEALARFMREGKAAARLRSEHVAQVLDVGRLEGGQPYMVMEFLHGRDLSALIKADGPQPVERAVSLVLQACAAVAEAHTAGIVHRDLKPANLFLASRPDGTPLVKVLDFGISKVARAGSGELEEVSMTSTRAMLGSPAYMSPEQMRSAKSVDGRTDIWALGIILYELLTAQAPFDADSLPGLIAAIMSDAPVAVERHRTDLPPALSAVVMRCLEKEPTHRFDSVAALACALEAFAPSEDAALVARIVRLQKSAGLTQLNTTRSPAPSTSSEVGSVHQPASQLTAATFGVTVRTKSPSRRVLAAALIAVGCVVVGGGVAFWASRGSSQSLAATAVNDEASAVAVSTEAPSVDAGVEQPAMGAGHADAGLEGANDAAAHEAAPSSTAASKPVTAPDVPKRTKPATTGAATKEAREHVAPPPTKTSKPKTEPSTLDLSERR